MVVVTISGPPGAGTTTAAKMLAERLDVAFLSTGEIFRKMADERGMSLEEFGDHVEDHPEIDRELDRRQKERALDGDVVLEGRLSGVVADDVPDALTVYLRCSPKERARRVAERDGMDEETAFDRIWQREAQEKDRYMRVYGVDPDDPDHYDLVLDSGRLGPEGIVEEILAAVQGA